MFARTQLIGKFLLFGIRFGFGPFNLIPNLLKPKQPPLTFPFRNDLLNKILLIASHLNTSKKRIPTIITKIGLARDLGLFVGLTSIGMKWFGNQVLLGFGFLFYLGEDVFQLGDAFVQFCGIVGGGWG